LPSRCRRAESGYSADLIERSGVVHSRSRLDCYAPGFPDCHPRLRA